MNLNTTGGGNTAYGSSALYNNTTGGNNTAIGSLAATNFVSGNSNTFLGYNACSDVTSANNFFCFGNGANTIFAANSLTGNMILGNGNGQITINGDLYVTGNIYSDSAVNNPAGSAQQDIDSTDEIKGQNGGGLSDDQLNISQNENSINEDAFVDSDNEETLISYTPTEKFRDSNINKSQQSINAESFDAIDVRLTSIDQSIVGLGNRIDGLDTRVSTLEQSIISTVTAMEDGFAMSAAIAARPTPNTLGWSFTAGAGNYASSNALSAGFIYVNPNYAVSINFAEAEGSSDNMTNIGVSYNLTNLFRKK